jgi:membrane-bound lytic murein transglycosylase D
VHVEGGTSLAAVAEAAGVPAAELRDLNPALLRGVTPPDVSVWVKVPVGTSTQAEMGMAAFPEELRRGYRTVTVKGSSTTPAALAKREGLTLAQLRQFNPGLKTTRKGRLSAGQVVRIPTAAVLGLVRDVPDPGIERYGRASAAPATGAVHVVRRGETLGGIARRYKTTVARLQALNGLTGTRVAAGQRLTVRGSSPSTRTASATTASGTKASAKQTPAKQTPAKQTPAKQTPAKQTSAKQTPAKQTSAKQTPAKQTSAKQTPAKKAPAKKPPAKKPPAKKPVAKTAS